MGSSFEMLALPARLVPAARLNGGNLEGYVSRELDLWVEQTGKGLAVNSNTGFRLPDSSLRLPDAAWISPERWNSLSPAEQENVPHFCPISSSRCTLRLIEPLV